MSGETRDVLKPTVCGLCGERETHYLGTTDERTIGRCVRCGLRRTLEIAENYGALYTTALDYHTQRGMATRSTLGANYLDRTAHDYGIAKLRIPRLLRHFTLLDVGCANGGFIQYARELGIDAQGLELNPAMAALTREATGAIIHTSWDTIPWTSYDFITYHDVIEHVPDLAEELARVRRRLRPGGMLVLDTPDADDPRFEELGMAWHHMKPKEHLWFFDTITLSDLVRRSGFIVRGVETPIQGKLVIYAKKEHL